MGMSGHGMLVLPLLAVMAACQSTSTAPPAAMQPAATAAAPAMVPAAPRGYLMPGQFDVLAVLPPAPVAGETRYENDRRVFQATRAFEGSARWKMASDDAQIGAADLLRHFACSLDAELASADVPATLRVLQRSTRDAGAAMNTAKEHYRRQRPFHIDSGSTCRPVAELGDSFDYPSGHTMVGWTWGQVLAQLVPERAAAVLARGRAIGDSRVVCGVHNASAVEGGRLAASSVLAVLAALPEWRQDFEAARGELAVARVKAPRPDPQQCAAESALIALPVG